MQVQKTSLEKRKENIEFAFREKLMTREGYERAKKNLCLEEEKS